MAIPKLHNVTRHYTKGLPCTMTAGRGTCSICKEIIINIIIIEGIPVRKLKLKGRFHYTVVSGFSR